MITSRHSFKKNGELRQYEKKRRKGAWVQKQKYGTSNHIVRAVAESDMSKDGLNVKLFDIEGHILKLGDDRVYIFFA